MEANQMPLGKMFRSRSHIHNHMEILEMMQGRQNNTN